MTDPPARRRALFVANDTFHSPGIPRLYAPVADAHALRELLRDPEIGAFAPAEMLVNESKGEIERGIERLFRGAGPDDVVLFYFSGHGIRTRQNLYLVTSNTDADLISSSAVSASFIRELIRETAAATTIILLDCCYSGAFLGGEMIKSHPTIDDFGHDLASGDGICVLTATTAVQVAEDGGPDRSAPLSVFTAAIVQGIASGLADDGTGLVNTHSLWRYVSAEVRGRTSAQTPSHYGMLKEEVHIARTRRRLPAVIDGSGRVALGGLLGRLESTPDRGLWAENWWGAGRLVVPIGQQRRPDGGDGETVWLDFAGPDRSLIVVGRSGSGKSTFLRTLVGALALTHSPHEVRIFALESSNRVGSLRELPHIARVVGDDEPEEVRSLLREIVEEIRVRKRLYRDQAIDSPGSLRSVRSGLAHGPVPDLFLLLDRWADFADLLPDIAVTLKQIVGMGPEYAVHVVATLRDWREVPDWLADLVASHVELRLHRPDESRVDRERAMRLPEAPGWALVGQRPFRIAMPDIRGIPADVVEQPEMTDGAADLVTRITRSLGSRRGEGGPRRVESGGDNDFTTLYGIIDPADLDLERRWQPKYGADRLRIPFGVDDSGRPVLLDLKQSAENGMGPHGLIIGSTGSGLRMLIRTLVLGLAIEHAPEQLNLLLVEFDGSRILGDFAGLPHVAGYVGNMVEDLSLVRRFEEALSGELNRRQELFRELGNFSSIHEYQQARAVGAPLEPTPDLIVIVTGFTELLSEVPDFATVLTAVGRLGRTLGVYLLLASRRLDETLLRGLESHLSYRIGLKTFSASESRVLLDVPDAYTLPSAPGSGFLRTHPGGELIRFMAAHSSRAVLADRANGAADIADRPLWEVIVDAVPADGRRSHQVWLPPLGAAPTVGALMSPTPGRKPGLSPVAIGIVDKPQYHRYDLLFADLSGSQGNAAVVGGAQAGKSTVLLTLILALAAAHTPAQVQFYCLGFSGGAMSALAGLAHVGAVAGRRDLELARRTLAELTALVRRRGEIFRQAGIVSMREYRYRKAELAEAGTDPTAGDPVGSDPFGDVFLVIDGYDIVRGNFEALESIVTDIASRGLAFGVHVVLSAGRWGAIRPALKDRLGTRVELRLGDPTDSEPGRKMASSVPLGRPGRGLTPDGEHLLMALPSLDARGNPAEVVEGLVSAVHQVNSRSPGPGAPEIRLLPLRLAHDELLRAVAERDAVVPPRDASLRFPLGLNESELAPVYIDFGATPHFVIFADAESGKTNLLRLLVSGICASNDPAAVQIVAADPKRTLLGDIPSGCEAAYATTASSLTPVMADLVAFLEKRAPPPDVTPQQLRDRSWWSGPELYVLVDDYELLASGGESPLSLLLEHLPHARDLGFHLILARRASGAARALYDPVIARMKDLGSAGLVMSGNREEGVLLGTTRPTPLPPGRGVLVTRAGEEMIQTALVPPAAATG